MRAAGLATVPSRQVTALREHHVWREQAALASMRRVLKELDHATVPAHHEAILRRWEALTCDPTLLIERWSRLLGDHCDRLDPMPSWSEVQVRGEASLAAAGWGREMIEHQKELDRFFAVCDTELESLITGELDIRQLLFENGTLSAASALYQNNPISSSINAVVAQEIADLAAQAASPISVLEVGAGTGALTDVVLDALNGKHARYLFTDVSRWFLNRARLRYAGRPGLTFSMLDINDMHLSGVRDENSATGFDVIACGNVAHNAVDPVQLLKDLSQFLRDSGVIYLIETGTEHLPLQISMRFLMAPTPDNPQQRFLDARAETGRIFLTYDEWVDAAGQAGLAVCERYPDASHPLAWLDQFSLTLTKENEQS